MSEPTVDEIRFRELSARVDLLAGALGDAQRQLRGAQLRHTATFGLLVVVLVALGGGVGGLGVFAQPNPITRGRFMTPFEVVDPGGRTVLSVDVGESGGFVRIGNENTGGLTFGVGKSGAGFLSVRGATGSEAVTVGQLQGGPMALRIASADGKGVAASLGLDNAGRGLLNVGLDGAGGIFAGNGASGSGYIIVRNPKGQSSITMGQREGRPVAVSVFDTAGTGTIAELGADQSGAGSLIVRGKDQREVASIGPSGGFAMALNFTGFGSDSLARLGVRDSAGQLMIGDENRGGMTTGVGKTGGFALFRNASGNDAIALGGYGGGEMAVRVLDDAGANPVAFIGRSASGGGGALTIGSTASPLLRVAPNVSPADARVTIGAGQKGNVVVGVSNASKATVASFGEAGVGGGVFAAHSATGTIRALLSGSVGELHVADESGVTRATVVGASTGGAVSVRNASGTTIVRLGEGQQGGLFQLANSGGSAMVEAGILPGGTGVVRAYPLGNPALGLVGMPGTFIMGFGGGK